MSQASQAAQLQAANVNRIVVIKGFKIWKS